MSDLNAVRCESKQKQGFSNEGSFPLFCVRSVNVFVHLVEDRFHFTCAWQTKENKHKGIFCGNQSSLFFVYLDGRIHASVNHSSSHHFFSLS